MSPPSNREGESGLGEEEEDRGGGTKQVLVDNWLALLLGGGVRFGIMVIRIGGEDCWRRGFRRRVISCSS